MKKKLLFLMLMFAGFCAYAQNPALFSAEWKITKIVKGTGTSATTHLPPPMPYSQTTNFSVAPAHVNVLYFNMMSADLVYSGTAAFVVNNKTCSLADYWDDNGEVNNFFGMVCDFFKASNQYSYTIEKAGNEKRLVIIASNLDEIHFAAPNLAATDGKVSKISILPNPVQDKLTVQDSKEIRSVKIFDEAGKLVREVAGSNRKSLNMDLRKLQPGVYFISVNDDKAFKIIKK